MAQQPNAILAISSTDRYITNVPGNVNQPIQNVLTAQYFNQAPYSNDFQITAPGALINGYIEKLIVSQIQLQYYLPTIVPGRNDSIIFRVETAQGSGQYDDYQIFLPYGFFSPAELAATLQIFMNTAVYGIPNANFSVYYGQGNIGAVVDIGFTVILDDNGRRFSFDDIFRIQRNLDQTQRLLKTFKLYGFNFGNSNPQTTQISTFAPVLLYTPYIDIYSDALTNYQALKDTDSSTSRRKGLLSRVYLSGVGSPQFTEYNVTFTRTIDNRFISKQTTSRALGSEPFVLTYDLNSPKVINWTPDTAVNSLDFQLRDCYGDLLFTNVPNSDEVFNTEFQMTLLCVEAD